MKKVLIALACALALASIPTTANAATITLAVPDAYFLGQVIPGHPSDPADEVDYINYLLGMEYGNNCGVGNNEPCIAADGGQTYDRSQSLLDVSGLPDASLVGSWKQDVPPDDGLGIDVSGYTYIIAKYDAGDGGAYVWYVANLETVDLPLSLGTCGNGPGCGLSNYTLFNPTSVPDGGATLMLLGGALVALGALRRRFSA